MSVIKDVSDVIMQYPGDNDIPPTAQHMALTESLSSEGFYSIALRVELAKFYAAQRNEVYVLAVQR